MASQNLVSAVITPEKKAELLALIGEIGKKLDFLTSLGRSDIQALVKVGNSYSPFLEKAWRAVNDHPDIMPKLFNLEEFNNDYLLAKNLADIGEQLKTLSEAVQNTLLAASSDTMVGALEVYAAIKANSDRVPGLKAVGSEMMQFFKKTRTKAAQMA
jgi:hypothetical protein